MATPERDLLLRLVERGLTVRGIALELRRSPTTVRYWLKRHGLKTQRAAARVSPDEPMAREVVRKCRTHGRTKFVLEGRGYYRCTRCRGARVAAWRRRVRRTLVEDAGGRCVLCGYERCVGALAFHHVVPSEKKFGLSFRGMTRSLAELRAEAKKCLLLCSNCHAEVEAGLTPLPLLGQGDPGLQG